MSARLRSRDAATFGHRRFSRAAAFREADGSYSNAAAYPELSLVQPATHDHPPLAAAWASHWRDIDLGRDIPENQRELRRLMRFAGLEETAARIHPSPARSRAARHLQANSRLAVVMLTDVFARAERFNTPGSVSPDNWSARAPHTVAEMDRNPNLLAKGQTFARLIRETGRGTASQS